MISNYLSTFNSENKQYTSSDSLIKFLNANYSDWKNLITVPEEFMEFFKTDVKVYQNHWLKSLADEIFDIVSDDKLVEKVWNDTTMNEWYRYAALRRLMASAPDTYLPVYINELISGGFNLGGWGFSIISELYDFPDSVKVVLESKKYEGNNFEFLARKACEHWQEYPQDLRNKILQERDYFLRKNGDEALWQMMTLEEKLYLTNVIIANEYAMVHDAITYANFLNDRDKSKAVLYSCKFRRKIIHIETHNLMRDEVPMPPKGFDIPEYDAETRQYTPSEQITRFNAIAETDSNNMVSNLLKQTLRNLHSAMSSNF